MFLLLFLFFFTLRAMKWCIEREKIKDVGEQLNDSLPYNGEDKSAEFTSIV